MKKKLIQSSKTHLGESTDVTERVGIKLLGLLKYSVTSLIFLGT